MVGNRLDEVLDRIDIGPSYFRHRFVISPGRQPHASQAPPPSARRRPPCRDPRLHGARHRLESAASTEHDRCTGCAANPGSHWPSSLLLLVDHTTVDARSRTFDDTALDSDGFGVGVKFHKPAGSRDDLCLVGGTITSGLDPENTPWTTWHRVTGLYVLTPDIHVVGARIYNQGDAIAFSSTATNWSVTGLRIDGANGRSGYIHDDCIQNDGMNSGVIDDSKLDGCTVFMSAMDNGAVHERRQQPGRGEELARLAPPVPQQLQHGKYGFDQPRRLLQVGGEPSKDGVAPKLYVHDSIFRADDPGGLRRQRQRVPGPAPRHHLQQRHADQHPDVAGRRAGLVDEPERTASSSKRKYERGGSGPHVFDEKRSSGHCRGSWSGSSCSMST